MNKEEREALIKKHGEKNLKMLEVPTDDLGSQTIDVAVRIPDRSVMSQYMKYSDVNPKKAQEILVKYCVLSHLEQILDDDALFMTTVSLLAELIPIREGRVKKF
ncbi:conserved hypothetical protein [Flavobacterium psychrophilum]|uniref:hypothetical protein n=1 Tax=Flavobacterium psychrophilum TaxID=96345 RepID=UPI000B7C1537|nr:hypothetical protein [Flavobacterium psychrophilum]EKT3957691.1 hypothetical protein [Flavobacterium psychrophilum]EKT4510345.1 hypothetical protein [Flavobacterium psychrophilum]SNA83379.1 conserved hypothetical protein [Flavobacterium psychrophilum]